MRPELSYANVVSTLCLFLLLGGGAAYAASHLGKNSVGSKQLKKNAVTEAKIKNEAVSAAKVKKGTLTGAQINSSTLGTVPSANHAVSADHAASADQAGGAANGAVSIDYFAETASDPPPSFAEAPAVHEIFNRDGMNLRASCIDAGAGKARLYVTIGSSVEATFQVSATRFNNPGQETSEGGASLSPEENFSLTDKTGVNRSEVGELIYRNATNVISVLFRAAAQTHTQGCEFVGTATSAG